MNPTQQPQIITVSIFEDGTDKQVSFSEETETDPPFFVAVSCLESHVEKICGSKTPGSKVIFGVYCMVNQDYPVRIDFEVCYAPTNRTSYRWIVPQDIDAFPTVNLTSDGPKVVLRHCAQVQRFSSYQNIITTFENRIRSRLDRKLGRYVEPKLPFDGNVEQVWEPVDFVIRLAKGDNLEQVARALSEANERGGENSWQEVKETVELLSRGCSDEISILRTIYEMEGNQASCTDIVAKAKAMLHDYDQRHARGQQPGEIVCCTGAAAPADSPTLH